MPTETFHTSLSSDQAMNLLRAEISAPLSWASGNRFFFGKLSDSSFQVRPTLWYRGIYPPQFDGRLEACTTSGSYLHLDYPASSSWLLSLGLFGLLLGSMLVSEFRSKIINWNSIAAALGISTFFALIIWGTQTLFRYEIKKSRVFLINLLQLEEIPTDG